MSSKETLQLIIHWLNHKHHAFQCQTTRETQEDSPRTLRFLATDINHQPSKNWSSQNKVEPTEVMYAICYGILLHVSTIFEGFFYCSGARTTQFWTCHWWTSQIFIFKFAWKETYMTWVSSKVGGMPMAFLDLFFFPWYSQTNPLPPRTVGVILNSSVFQGKISKIGELSHCFQLRGPGPSRHGLSRRGFCVLQVRWRRRRLGIQLGNVTWISRGWSMCKKTCQK